MGSKREGKKELVYVCLFKVKVRLIKQALVLYDCLKSFGVCIHTFFISA